MPLDKYGKQRAIELITNSSKPCTYTYGLKSKNPTTLDENVSTERAAEIISKSCYVDVYEKEDRWDINAYSTNDLF